MVQVSHSVRPDYEALFLARARLAAIAHGQIALAAVGAERREQDARALVDQVARKLGKLAVVADEHAHRPAISLDDVDFFAALDVPPIAFVGGRVDFLARMGRSIAQIGRAHVCTPVTNGNLVCRLLLEKKKNKTRNQTQQLEKEKI